MKNCLKNFWVDFKNSLYGGDYKKHFGSKSFWDSIKYLLKLIFIEAILLVLFVSIFFIPAVKFILDKEKITNFIDSHIPQGASVEIKDGMVTTGDGKPIYIEGTEEMKREGVDYLIVVDPTIKSTENILEVFKTYKTANLVTSNSSLTMGEDGSISMKSLEGYPDYIITKDSALDMYDKARPYIITFVPILFFLGLVMMILFGMMFSLFMALITSTAIMYIAKLLKKDFTYKQSYIVAIYALTPAFVVSVIFILIFGQPLMFWWIIIISLIATSLNLIRK